MKVAVLTMTLTHNYGGMLQAYALMETLKRMGHEPELIFVQLQKESYTRLFLSIIKKLILKHLLNKQNLGNVIPDWYWLMKCPGIDKNTKYFVDTYINPKTEPIFGENDFRRVAHDGYDAYVVGSDQVWRPKMYRFLHHAFFDFVKKTNAIRLSYAASFGVDKWEYSKKETIKYRAQIKNFKAVSVREDTGVDLCKKYLICDAIQVLDPTLLLTVDDYREIILKENEQPSDGDLLCYILDPNNEKDKLINYTAATLGLKPFHANSKANISSSEGGTKYPTVTSWLKAFDDAKYVITDSYHGCVFAILFKKPFIVYGNALRGITRFTSLLKIFGKEDRLIYNFDELECRNLLSGFDWGTLDGRLTESRDASIAFLKSNLKIN